MNLDLAAGYAEVRRQKRRTRAESDLFFLCADILGYRWNPALQRGMTEEFHLPLCRRMDGLRAHDRVGTFCARWHLKTTVFTIGLAIQEILRNPNITILISHAVDEQVENIVSEIANHFLANKELRKLAPEIAPSVGVKRWAKANQFTVRRPAFSRQPTVLGRGAGAEITGAHVDLILLDDIIGRRTIEDSQLPKIASWYRNTVLPVLNPGGRLRAVGTRWHVDDLWGTFIADKAWHCVVRGALERDGVPDESGEPVLYGPGTGEVPGGLSEAAKRLHLLQREMGPDFAPQMQNDPSPAGEKPWDRTGCEHFISLSEAKGPGALIVLSDPAPAKTGSLDARGARQRGDGTKDDWATCVVKVRRRGLRREVILLDGRRSKTWDVDEGFDQICQLKRKWHVNKHAVEATGQAIALYEHSHRQAARRSGVAFAPVKLSGTYRGQAKNAYFSALASLAKNDEFLICAESCDKDFLDMFLAQAREWRPLDNGGNGLRYDDCANVVSFATDPEVMSLAPVVDEQFTWSPFQRVEKGDDMEYGARHVRW